MTVIRLKYVQKFKDRHGKMRYYFRRPGISVVLPGDPGSTEFMAAYQKAIDSQSEILEASKIKRIGAGSLDALAISWYSSASFAKNLQPITQKTYRNILERLRADHGDKPVALITSLAIRKIMLKQQDTPDAANITLKVLRAIMKHAVDIEMRPDNPAIGVEKLKVTSKGFHTWTEEEIDLYEAHWPIGTRERLAIALLSYTGQRRGDVVKMGPRSLRDGVLEFTQQKTGQEVAIPLHPDLKAIIDATVIGTSAFLVTGFGKPFTAAGFGNWFREKCDLAKVPAHCSAHGLRKAAARRLAEAGHTAHQIMAITGHTSLSEVQRYTRAADRRKMAKEAIGSIGRPAQKDNDQP
jgi:integrase